jgi:hypothetical protein
LDAIGDTHLALQEFVSCDDSFDLGINYILAYGVLQAIFLQQDALKHLAFSLGHPFELPDALKEIRELRNKAVGHPTQKALNKNTESKSFHHIARVSLTKNGFQLLSTYSDIDSFDSRDVNFVEIIRVQTEFSEHFLTETLQRLNADKDT